MIQRCCGSSLRLACYVSAFKGTGGMRNFVDHIQLISLNQSKFEYAIFCPDHICHFRHLTML